MSRRKTPALNNYANSLQAVAFLLASYKQVAGKLKMAINPVLLRSTKRRSNHFRGVTK